MKSAGSKLLAYLREQPGAAPRALQGSKVTMSDGAWDWRPALGNSENSILVDIENNIRIAVANDVVVQRVGTGRLLLSRTVGDSAIEGLALALVDLQHAAVITDIRDAAGLGRNAPWIVSPTAMKAEALIANKMAPGLHEGFGSDEFAALPTTIYSIGDHFNDEIGDRYGAVTRRFFRIVPSQRQLFIGDLPWYNQRDWNLQRHKLTRIAPFPGRTTLVAEIANAGLVELTADGDTIVGWLLEDPTYQPSSCSFARRHGYALFRAIARFF